MLEHALSLISEPKPFSIAVSGAIRVYLEERFQFHAPDRTTEEFLYELQESNLLTPEQKQSLADFLESCDLIKFAKYEPTETELRALHASALRLVNETEPREMPAKRPIVRARAAAHPRNKMIFAHPYVLLLLLLLPVLAWLKGKFGQSPAFLYSSVDLVRPISGLNRSNAGSYPGRLALAGAGSVHCGPGPAPPRQGRVADQSQRHRYCRGH